MPSRASSKKSATSAEAPVAISPGTTSLGDFRERFMARAAELAARPDIKILWNYVGEPKPPEEIQSIAEKAGLHLSPAEIELYARSNGWALVWVSTHAPEFDSKVHKAKKGMPTLQAIESLNTAAFRMIVMPPLEKVVQPLFDYSKDLDEDSPPRLGFDFPGQFLTPALVTRDGKTVVQVGDDYGADWSSSRTSSLEDYVETTLATWGDVPWRRAIYLRQEHGVGRAYFEANPVALASLLPPPPPPSAKEEAALLRTLKRTQPKDVSDELLAKAVEALRSKNDDLLRVATQCLSYNLVRAAPHLHAVVVALEQRARDQSWNRQSADAFRVEDLTGLVRQIPAPLGTQDAEVVLRYGGSQWGSRARVVRNSGDALLGTLATLLDGDIPDKLSAIGAAILLGPVAAPLLPKLEALTGSKEEHFHLELSSAAGMAIVSIDPSRAEQFEQALRAAVNSNLPQTLRNPDDETPILAPFFSRLPASSQSLLAHDIAGLQGGFRQIAQFGLLMALGSAGAEVAFQLIEKNATAAESSDGGFVKRYTMCIVLPQCSLSPENRSRAISVVERELLAEKERNNYWHSEYLTALLALGGSKSLPPTVTPKDLESLDPERFSGDFAPLKRALIAFRAGA